MAVGTPVVDSLVYRTDSSDAWMDYDVDTVITLANVGDYVQFRNLSEKLSTSTESYVQFSMTGEIAASGNIQSMLNWNSSCNDYCYYNLFNQCKGILNAPELSVSKLGISCYENMFNGCEGLKNAPKLISEILVDSCYKNMFSGCASLKIAPELPATTLA